MIILSFIFHKSIILSQFYLNKPTSFDHHCHHSPHLILCKSDYNVILSACTFKQMSILTQTKCMFACFTSQSV